MTVMVSMIHFTTKREAREGCAAARVSVRSASINSRSSTSIRPVTAAEMRAVRRSRRSRTDTPAFSINSLNVPEFVAIKRSIDSCSSAGLSR